MDSSFQAVSIERIKRRIDAAFSPMNESQTTCSNESVTKKRSAFKRLQFNFNDSPVPIKKSPIKVESIEFYDENSCDSGFSDLKDNANVSQATSMDDSMYQMDENISFELFEQIDTKTVSNDSISTFDEPIIKKALDSVVVSNERLIGDMSRSHTLPILNKSKHNDLASITPETLSDLIKGQYDVDYMIIDARYPYEFEGGHIQNAENGYLREKLFDKLFDKYQQTSKPRVLIFHCEFSSERGPKLMRDLREMDRSINKQNYPSLYYPEIYLLEGGYKEFYIQFDQYCLPKSYLPMLHDNHRSDMKFFRKKSKTWEMETRKRITKSKLSF